MRHGLIVANIGSYAEPETVVSLAVAAEAAGWEALLLWDHLGFVWDAPSADPWVILAAVASRTSKLMLGTAITPVARYRPHRLAMTIATLSALSRSGIVLGAGLGGVPGDFSAFGEDAGSAVRAERLDEGLDVISQLLTGRKIEHSGRHFKVDGVSLAPAPPTPVPIWIGGNSHAALARASRWDGWIADSTDALEMTMEPEELARSIAWIGSRRAADRPLEVAVLGYSAPGDTDLTDGYRQAGATWWLEAIHDLRGPQDEVLARVKAGPAP
jgi:alkanesulfonate monooxygenase SsuD/methylene tetrahydromethanopterin reductase-like flavin-dependent oxidoreductase (luciferase family)